jgi:hypothetical protein
MDNNVKIIERIENGQTRKVWYIEVDDLPVEKAQAYVQDIISRMKE